jgi:hypothetical protein
MTSQEDKGSDTMSHQTGSMKGEEQIENQGAEAGRVDERIDESGRPTSTRTARDSTGINPEDEDPIDPAMPPMPPA